MSDTANDKPDATVEGNYEQEKASFSVMDVYEVPAWYKKHIWLWPMVAAWLVIVIVSAPGAKLNSALIWGGIIVVMDICMILVEKHWPI